MNSCHTRPPMYVVTLLLTLIVVASARSDPSVVTHSGHKLPLAAIRAHIPSIEDSQIHRLLFELLNTGLVSYSSVIPVPLPSNASHVTASPLQRSHNGVRLPDQNLPTLLYHSANGYTFVFDSLPDSSSPFAKRYPNFPHALLAAWGPSLMLHPLDPVKHPGVYLNAALYKFGRFQPPLVHPNTMDVSGAALTDTTTRSDITAFEPCSRLYTFELGIAHDSSFCAMHGGSRKAAEQVVRVLVYELSKVFQTSVCVRLNVISLDSFCGSEGEFHAPPNFRACLRNPVNAAKEHSCKASQALLELISHEWQAGVSAGSFRDAGFFLSGYKDRTDLAGATYRAQACNEQLSFAWVEHGIAPVFAHEIGHMLGAHHDVAGVMTPAVGADQPVVLSNNSRIKIRRFVELDSRAWCLRRDLQQYPPLQRAYKWNNVGPVLSDFENTANVSDVTFAQAYDDEHTSASNSNTVENDFIYLIARRSPTMQIAEVHYSIMRGMECDENSRCFVPSQYRESPVKQHKLPFRFKSDSFAFSVAFARLQSHKSRDLIIMHIRPYPNSDGIPRMRPFYRVGLGIGKDGSSPPLENWSREHSIPNFVAEDIQCASISAVSVIQKSKSVLPTTNVLYVHIDRKKNRNVLQYWIGKDISMTGHARGGWTYAIDVPGWYGRSTTGVSASMLDMDGNGMPELIMYHVDNTITMKTGFLRIGKDVNSTGHVTNGWSDFIQSPNLDQYVAFFRSSGTMAVHPLMGLNKYPVVAAVQRQGFFNSWDVTVGASVLTPVTLATSRFRGGVEDLTLGCSECYSFEHTRQCKIDLERCEATIDEVKLKNSVPVRVIKDSDYDSSSFQAGNKESRIVKFDGYEDDEIQRFPNRPNSTISNSFFCAGFHFLYKFRSGCDVVDRETVVAKGVEVSFREAMEELDPSLASNMNSTSLFEVPAGTNKDFKAVVAEFSFQGKRQTYMNVVGRAFRMIRKKGFGAIADPERDLRRHVQKKGSIWTVKFFFKQKHFLESSEV